MVGALMRAAQGTRYTGDSGEYSREGFSEEVSFRGGAGKVLSCSKREDPSHPLTAPP